MKFGHIRFSAAETMIFRSNIGVDSSHEKSTLIVDVHEFWTLVHHTLHASAEIQSH